MDEIVNLYLVIDGSRTKVASLMLCDIDCDKVSCKIGVDAPGTVEVFREEIDPHMTDKRMGRRSR